MALPATIRGHQALFKLFQDGEEVVIDSITRVSVNQETSITKHYYVGNPVPEGDQQMMGWSGSFEMEVRNDVIERFIDSLTVSNQNGIAVPDYTFMIREQYADGSVSVYVYSNCFFKYAREQSGLDSKVTKTIEFQASNRIRVA